VIGRPPGTISAQRRRRMAVQDCCCQSSWMNQIETWFGIITRQAIRRGTFQSVRQLIRHIDNYISHWNEQAAPFTWTATTDDIIGKVQILQRDFQKLLDVNKNAK
jgi:hypothetical protein